MRHAKSIEASSGELAAVPEVVVEGLVVVCFILARIPLGKVTRALHLRTHQAEYAPLRKRWALMAIRFPYLTSFKK